MPKSLASFCRLCLTKTASKVPVFGGDQENVTNLLALIELSVSTKIFQVISMVVLRACGSDVCQ